MYTNKSAGACAPALLFQVLVLPGQLDLGGK